MSDTPDEVRDHLSFICRSKGDLLIAGLGLGMCARSCLLRDDVKSVTIIEQSHDVIALVGPWLTDIAVGLGKPLEIVQADILTWDPPRGRSWDSAWFDIWDTICEDNLPEMHRLHRKFARRAAWKGSWCRELIERQRRSEVRHERLW